MSEISAENLLAAGYREFAPSVIDKGADRLFQKRFDGPLGKRYFITFRQWTFPEFGPSFDAQICCGTDTDGHIWVTIKEPSIEETEKRADAIWRTAGGVYYELEDTP